MKRLKTVVIAYSGGLDSTFLLKVALDMLGRKSVLAVTARSETYPLSEYKEAKKIASSIGVRHLTINTSELDIKDFRNNPVNRCYYCKKELFRKLDEIRRKEGFGHVLDGTNLDDLKDIRYGRQAAAEIGVRSPLLEAKMMKADIRRFSKDMNLSTWDKPSFACLASRFPFNNRITVENLNRIDRAEEFLRRLGFRQVRARLHKDTARLEFYKEDFDKVLNPRIRDKIIRRFKSLGFKYVTLDLEGYRTGSMH